MDSKNILIFGIVFILTASISNAFYTDSKIPLCFTCLTNEGVRDTGCTKVNATVMLPDWSIANVQMVSLLGGSFWCGNYTIGLVFRRKEYNATN
jgi:hypothetical protein